MQIHEEKTPWQAKTGTGAMKTAQDELDILAPASPPPLTSEETVGEKHHLPGHPGSS